MSHIIGQYRSSDVTKDTEVSSSMASRMIPAPNPIPSFRGSRLRQEEPDGSEVVSPAIPARGNSAVRPRNEGRGSPLEVTWGQTPDNLAIYRAYIATEAHRSQNHPSLVLEGRTVSSSHLSDQGSNNLRRRKWALLLLFVLLLVTILLVTGVLVVTLQQHEKSLVTQAAATLSPSISLPPSMMPSISPSTPFPSSVPSTGSPTAAAFDSVVAQLNLTDVPTANESPAFRAIDWMATVDTLTPTLQRYALVVLYYATGGKDWIDQFGFLNPLSDECSDWSGTDITDGSGKGALCWDNGKIGALWFRANGLQGSIPSELAYLDQVAYVYFDKNSIKGTLPSELANLRNLAEFYAANNMISGSLPTELGIMPSLQILALSDNVLSGTLPSELGRASSLLVLSVPLNDLTGTLPSALVNMSSIEVLQLGPANYLTGSIPTQYGELTSLSFLGFGVNFLTGVIPTTLGNLKALQQVGLANNMLTGSIPVELDIPSLRIFAAFSNFLSGSLPFGPKSSSLELLRVHTNSLNGTIDKLLAHTKTKMAELDLIGNEISGTIPTTVCNHLALVKLQLGRSRFVRNTIPDCLIKLTNLRELSLFESSFTGTIPHLPASLTHLALHQNQLNGTLEQSVATLPSLEILNVFANSMSGTLPVSISEATALKALLLSHNALTGKIPSGLNKLTDLTSLFINGNMLSGELPEIDSLKKLDQLWIQQNNLTAGNLTTMCAGFEGVPSVRADCHAIACPCCEICCARDGTCDFNR